MPDVFASNEGTVVRIPGNGFPAIVSVPNFTDQNDRVLVSSMGFSQGANVQFMHTLRDVIYVYSFGEKMGQIRINGMLFFRDCAGRGRQSVPFLLQYYRNNSVSRNQTPIRVSLAGSTLNGFLDGVNFGGFNQQFGFASFRLDFSSLPAE